MDESEKEKNQSADESAIPSSPPFAQLDPALQSFIKSRLPEPLRTLLFNPIKVDSTPLFLRVKEAGERIQQYIDSDAPQIALKNLSAIAGAMSAFAELAARSNPQSEILSRIDAMQQIVARQPPIIIVVPESIYRNQRGEPQ